MALIEINKNDKKVYDYLKDFLPEKIIDVHTHIWRKEFEISCEKDNRAQNWPRLVADENRIEHLLQVNGLLFPNKKVYSVLMGQPCEIDYKKNNDYVIKVAKKNNFSAFALTHPVQNQEIIDGFFKEGFSGIKPYFNAAPKHLKPDEIEIFDYLPLHHLEVVNEHEGVVMLHIPRSGRLKDKTNIEQIIKIEKMFPKIKLIIAHIGRAYAPCDLTDAFEQLSQAKGLFFDFSANTLDYAIEQCIRHTGVNRLMFGSDMPITRMRMKRIVENNTYINIVPKGLYGDLKDDLHMRETEDIDNISFFIYEELLAFKCAADKLKLTSSEVENIMFNNAKSCFKIKEI